MERKIVLRNDVDLALKGIGIEKGQNVMVHTSLSSIGFVCGGAQIIIDSLLDAVGSEGTIMMPTQSWKNLDPDTGVHWEEPKEWYQIIRDNWPAYDKRITPTNTMGAVAEMFRGYPNTYRSEHPARSVAANGKYAKYLTESHTLENIFGEDSPIDRLYKLNGYVLLIGVNHDKNTCIHLADAKAEYPSKHNTFESSAILENGIRKWVTYETLFVDGEDFIEIGESFEKEGKVAYFSLGNATMKLMKVREIVDYAIEWIEKNRK